MTWVLHALILALPFVLGFALWWRDHRRGKSRDVRMIDPVQRHRPIDRTHLHVWPVLAVMTREWACTCSFGCGVVVGLLLALCGVVALLASTLRGNTTRCGPAPGRPPYERARRAGDLDHILGQGAESGKSRAEDGVPIANWWEERE